MSDELELLKKRFRELYEKADRGGYFTFTDFLGLSEQSAFGEVSSKFRHSSVVKFGGATGAERVMIRFGDADEIGYDIPFPIKCVRIKQYTFITCCVIYSSHVYTCKCGVLFICSTAYQSLRIDKRLTPHFLFSLLPFLELECFYL